MKFNNEYTNFVDNIELSDEFKKNLVKKMQEEADKIEHEKIKKNEEKLKKELKIINIKNKIAASVAAIGVLLCSGFAYATFVPEDFKAIVNQKINDFFGITVSEEEYSNYTSTEYVTGLQDETVIEVLDSEKENIEDYTELTDASSYGIGDSTEGSLIESNYKQYDWNIEYDENEEVLEKTLEKYEEPINIKIGKINYGFLEKLESESVVLDENGAVLEYKSFTIEETLKYQSDEFKTNWENYYYKQEKFDEDLYFKITGMLIMNGNNKSIENYNNYSRAKKIKIIFDNKQEEIVEIKDTKEAQYIDLEYISYDISKPINIYVEILETYSGISNEDTYVADIQFGIDSNIPQGR